jgi:hypothetical protein
MNIRMLTLACTTLALLQACSAEQPAPDQTQADQAQPKLPVAQQTAQGLGGSGNGGSSGGVGFVVAGKPVAGAAETPAPRDASGRAILGSAPGQVGSWEGFGSWPMLRIMDDVPEGSIMFSTPVQEALDDPTNFPKPLDSTIPYQPWAKALFEARSRTRFEPYVRCKPSAGPRAVATAYGTQFVEFPDMQKVYIFPTGGPRHFREIYLDGRDHPEHVKPTYHGHSIGHWEGDTLVVDTVGFNEKMWIDSDGSPHTGQLHTVEKFTRVSLERLKYEITIDDPGAYTQPWSSGFYMSWASGESFQFVCQDGNLATELMVGNGDEYKATINRSQPIFP